MGESKREKILNAIKEIEDDYNVHITYGKTFKGKVYLVARGKEGIGFSAYSLSDLRDNIESYRKPKVKSIDDED